MNLLSVLLFPYLLAFTAAQEKCSMKHKFELKHSEHWAISYQEVAGVEVAEISVYEYLPANVNNTHTYTLVPSCADETVTAQIKEMAAAAEGTNKYSKILSVPLDKGLALTQTTDITFLEVLGLRNEITAFASNPMYISSPCLNDRIDQNITKVYESVSGYMKANDGGQALVSTWGIAPGNEDAQIVVNTASESSVMAVYEWIKFYALLFDLDQFADATFLGTEERYNCVSSSAVMATEADPSKSHKVLWAYWSTWGNGWSVAECPNYYCEYATNCGATLLESNGVGSITDDYGFGAVYMTDEEFLSHGKDADSWIYVSNDWNSVYAAKKDVLDHFNSVSAQNVFDYTGKGSSSWFEQRMAEPDIVLADFCSVVGTQVDSSYLRSYFRNVFTEASGDAGVCANPDGSHQVTTLQCPSSNVPVDPVDPVVDSSGSSNSEDSSVAIVSMFMSSSLLFVANFVGALLLVW